MRLVICKLFFTGHYFGFGRLIALSVIHCGFGPNCFSEFLYNQILDRPRLYGVDVEQSTSLQKQLRKVTKIICCL